MLGKLSTLIGAVFCLVAMVAAILGEGPWWIRATGAVAISALLVAGAVINMAAGEAIGRIDAFLKNVEEAPPQMVAIVREVDEDDEDLEEDEDSGYH